ncbi:protein-L-isoaspartate(D-aspartate) O-methyltransferase [Luteimonas sp. J16]|nr:protein-L-isoaspartate(D-aspartate) O-methyltransferase [Luteimonas sp. J16]
MTPRLRLQPEAIGVGMTSQRVRDRLIERLRANGIRDERVLNAIRTVPRHLFVDEALATRAYEDTALPIGHGQTISQPWVVARMTEALFTDGHAPRKVLEVGTGSGYQATVLAALGLEVHTVERIGDLLRVARKRFRSLGLNVRSRHDDGRIGWPSARCCRTTATRCARWCRAGRRTARTTASWSPRARRRWSTPSPRSWRRAASWSPRSARRARSSC